MGTKHTHTHYESRRTVFVDSRVQDYSREQYGHSIDKVHCCYFDEENLRVIVVCIHVCIMYVYISMMDAEKV